MDPKLCITACGTPSPAFEEAELFMQTSEKVTTVTGALETGVWKLGLIMLALGVMHLFNIFVLGRFRKRYQAENLNQLVPPPPRAPRFSPETRGLAAPN